MLSRVALHPQRSHHPDVLWRAVLYLSSYCDQKVRDGELALKLLSELPMPDEKSPSYSTCRAIRAAVYAEAEKWDKALGEIEDAVEHASSSQQRKQFTALQRQFADKKPYRLDPRKGVDQPLFSSFFWSLGR